MSNSRDILMNMIQAEVSTMAGGAVQGTAEKDEEKELREMIRGLCREIVQQQAQALQEEVQLRNVIKELIYEAKKEVDDAPHNSTAINLLEELLKQILPSVETDFKTLTTNAEQRSSFRANLLDAVSKLLAAEDVNANAKTEDAEPLEEIDIQIQDTDEIDFEPTDDKFIDIDATSDAEEDGPFGLQDQEETGRNMAAKTYERIEKNIVDSYSILSDNDDRKTFRDYLITNLKLYFDKYEAELSTEVDEPTTDAYEKEQNQLANKEVEADDAEMGFE
jgi:hypothetical protein